MQRSRCQLLVSPRPADEDLDVVALDLTSAIDTLVDALLYLVPAHRWPPPQAALRSALQLDEGWTRTNRRIREVMDRIREAAPSVAEDVNDLESVVREGLLDSAGIGHGIGVRLGLGQRLRGEA